MATACDLPKLSAEFERIALTFEEDGIARLASPGVEGLQIFLASVVEENPIAVEEVRRGYEAKGWSEDRSLIWSEVKALVGFLVKDTVPMDGVIADTHASEFAKLCETICKRQEAKVFPLVKPSDLESEEEQEAAAMSLALITQIEHGKFEFYIAEERRKNLEAEFGGTSSRSTEQVSGSQDWKLKEAEWNYSNHYPCLRWFLATESFQNKKFSHRCEGNRFLSLIPPGTIQDEEKKQHAHGTVAKVKDALLPTIDAALWKAWSEIETLIQVTGEDASEVFLRFVTEDYLDIIEKTCDEASAEPVLSFVPLFPPEAHATEIAKNERLLVLKHATMEASCAAEAEMKQAYVTFRNSRPTLLLKYLPETAPSPFAVEHYYAFLKKMVYPEDEAKHSTEVPLAGKSGSSAATSESTEVPAASSLEGILSSPKRSGMNSEILASPVRRKRQCVNPTEPKVAKVVELHADGKVGDICHFTGCLVYCEDEVRHIDANNVRTALSEETLVLNLTLADEDGAIQVTLWREIAKLHFPCLANAFAAEREGSCAKVTLTYLVLKEPRSPAVQSVRVLHSTEKTQLSLEGEQRLLMTPDSRVLVTDFRRLKGCLPFTAHLKGVVVGEPRERLTNKGAEQICFTLMDRQRRTVACIAHDVSISSDTFAEGKEIVIFYASGQEGLRKTPGSVWIFSGSYVLSLGSALLPGVSSEEIRLVS